MSYTSWKGPDAERMRIHALKYLHDEPDGRFLITIHTHADVDTGSLCNAHSSDGTKALHNTIDEVLYYNIGEEILNILSARSSLSGLLLLACGSAVGPQHLEAIKRLLQK